MVTDARSSSPDRWTDLRETSFAEAIEYLDDAGVKEIARKLQPGTTMVVIDFAASVDTRTGPDFTVITEHRSIKGKRVKKLTMSLPRFRVGYSSVPLPESKRDARTARLAICPVAHNFRRDRPLLVEIKGNAGRDLGRVIVVIAIERISETVGNGVPGYGLT
jgi:hypothetical protein